MKSKKSTDDLLFKINYISPHFYCIVDLFAVVIAIYDYSVLFSTDLDTFLWWLFLLFIPSVFSVHKTLLSFTGMPFTFRYFYPSCYQSFCHLEVSTNISKSGETKSRLSEWTSLPQHHHHHHQLNSVVNVMSISLCVCVSACASIIIIAILKQNQSLTRDKTKFKEDEVKELRKTRIRTSHIEQKRWDKIYFNQKLNYTN